MMTCNLEWKNQSAFLIQALSSLRQNDTLTDCTLAAEGRHIKAHRLILCACSPYFKVYVQTGFCLETILKMIVCLHFRSCWQITLTNKP